MVKRLNPRILKKLEELDVDENIKEFLKKMLFYELERPDSFSKYGKKYDEAIKLHGLNYREKSS